MAVTPSTMVSLGTNAPDFSLPDTVTGKTVSLSDFKDAPALLIVFMCNHCPYVKHIINDFVGIAREIQNKGAKVVAISANDPADYPEDAPENLGKKAKELGFSFPYLFDESQEVAKAYNAACTPDFFLYDKDKTLVYRGQLDDSRPGNGLPVTGKDLKAAVEAVVGNKPIPQDQKPSIGCNIKWK